MESVNLMSKQESAWLKMHFGSTELLQGKINLRVKKRILQCYVFPVMKYGCESWTLNKDLTRRINAFEMWNILPEFIVQSPSVEAFKRAMDN